MVLYSIKKNDSMEDVIIEKFKKLVADLNLIDDVIKCYRINELVNINTTEKIGFVLSVYLNKKYEYEIEILDKINEEMKPGHMKIAYLNKSLQIKLKYYKWNFSEIRK